jgi:uncharacterized protein (UPF0548 family)
MLEKDLAQRRLTYTPVGATCPDQGSWTSRPAGFRGYERSVHIGRGRATWDAVSTDLLEWGVKTRSGFRVVPGPGAGARVQTGAHYWVLPSLGRPVVREPVRVVAVIDRPDRRGFAYGTLEGHPVSGEEAFVVHRTPDGEVYLTLRSLTRPAPGGAWRMVFPALIVAQRIYRRRYLRALVGS